VVIDIHAQDTNSPEQVLQRVGNYIISQTGDQVNDISTSAVISIPDTTSINKNAVYINSSVTGVKNERKPESCLLEQNYPNPFNPSTTPTYHIH
jgi:Holliday junction resolvasome RuvABC endonuclease subunit